MKRIGVIGMGIVVVSLVACARSSTEPEARQEQRLEVACTHAVCATGDALVAACDPCATQLCASDPYCCSDAWDATCVGEVASICGKSCTAPPAADGGADGAASTCAHPVCAVGPALAKGCDACATQLCTQDAYCCGAEWDATCVAEVASICKLSCL